MAEVDYVLVLASSVKARRSIYQQAMKLGYPDEKMIFVYNTITHMELEKIHAQSDDALRKISSRLYEEQLRAEQIEKSKQLTIACVSDATDKERWIGKGLLPNDEGYQLDYERFRTLELAVKKIRECNVPGATAELGVFRGVCSRLIHAHLPERRHYLFDSFESFRPEEVEKEIQRGLVEKELWEAFKNTSVAVAMQGMPSPETCVIRQGFFPESLEEPDKDERFAFVSLDADLEESTYQGLQFFYPRMEAGGFIFVHDGVTPQIQNAIQRYEKDLGGRIRTVQLSDWFGTIVIPV